MIEQIVINGLVTGLIYALIASGLTLAFSILGTMNFAHGELYMVSGFLFYVLLIQVGINYWLSLILTAIALGIVGWGLQRFFFRPLGKSVIAGLLGALGLTFAIGAAANQLFGDRAYSVSPAWAGNVSLGNITLSGQRLLVIISSIVVLVGLYFFIDRTKVGRAMKATSQDEEMSALFGVNVDNIKSIALAIGCGLAAVAAALISPVFCVTAGAGLSVVLKAIIIIIIGGLGSYPGAIIAALLLGFVESTSLTYLGHIAEAIGFAMALIILVIKPTGFLGREH